MITSDINSGNRIGVSSYGRTEQSASVSGASDNSVRLSALKPGDSIQAKIVSKDGENVKLQVDGNKVIDARISGGINLEPGKNIVFEVKSTTSGIMLSPLFTNTSSDPNISKALSMAGLPLNSDTVIMTKSMMQAGMGIDRTSLLNMFRDISAYSQADITDIVDLHRLGIEVNDVNVEQIGAYKNLSYQLGDGMNDVAGKLNDLLNELTDSVNSGADGIQKAAAVFEGLIEVASQYDFEAEDISQKQPEFQNADAVAAKAADDGGEALSAAERALKLLQARTLDDEVIKPAASTNSPTESNTLTATDTQQLTGEGIANLRNEILKLIDDVSAEGNLGQTGKPTSEADMKELLTFLKNSIASASKQGDSEKILNILNNDNIKDNVLAAVRAQWSITPSEVADKNNVKELYSRLQRQLDTINEALEGAGLKNTDAGNAAGNMSNNLDFLNQVNQMYAYVQLPLKLSTGDDAHGDLYVYSNGRKMSSNDGKVTALLHLDMEHLGPLDVFVLLDSSGYDKKVSTQFTVSDDSILDFLSLHMDELTKRLEAKGYNCKARLGVRGEEGADNDSTESPGGIRNVLAMSGSIKLSEYSFDVRT